MILEGTTSSGAVVPVQVTDQGKVVAEGLQGPQGPEGPQGPQGPEGPAGGYWERTGTVVSPTNAGDDITTTGDLSAAAGTFTGNLSFDAFHTPTVTVSGAGKITTPAVSLDPGSTGSPLVRDSSGNVGLGVATPVHPLHVSSSSVPAVGFYRGLNVAVVGAAGQEVHIGALDGATATAGAAIVGQLENPATEGSLIVKTRSGGTLGERMRVSDAGVFTLGNGTTNAVSLDPGSTGAPLVRDSVGRLLVGMNNAPAGTLAGDVVCQGAVVLQSPNGMWWAIEVQDDGTLYASQKSIR